MQSGLTPADDAEIREIRETPHLYSKMVESICPSVFGHQEVKRGVLLMLFGGVHKVCAHKPSCRHHLDDN